MLATFAHRIVSKAAMRGLFLALALGHDEVPLIDLRGQLPTVAEYPRRDMAKVNAIVVHHSATRGQSIRTIAEFHTQTRGWPAIAYHYAIGWDGKVYLLNDVDTRTNHAQGFNTRSIGVCFIGDYDRQPLTPEAVQAFSHLLAYLRSEHGYLEVLYHRDTKATECPGDSAVAALRPFKD